MGYVITIIIGLIIFIYAALVIKKAINRVKAGKCISCSVKSEDCKCHEVHDIINLKEGEKNKAKN